MPIPLSCDACGRELRVRDELAGEQIYCPDCRTILTVPGPAVVVWPAVDDGPAPPAVADERRDALSERAEEPPPPPPEVVATGENEWDDEAPRQPAAPPAEGGPNVGAVIGGLTLMGVSGILLLVLLTGKVVAGGLIKLIVVLFIAGIATFIRGLMGKSD